MTIIAPYTPLGSGIVNLGACRKIEIVVTMFSREGHEVLLINSAFNEQGPHRAERDDRIVFEDFEGFRIKCLVLGSRFRRPLAKLFCLSRLHSIAESVIHQYPVTLVWIYNPYSIELTLASAFVSRINNCRCVLEYEDAIFARFRFSLKPIVDFLAFQVFKRNLYAAVCVTPALANSLATSGIKSVYYPGLVSERLSQIPLTARSDRVTRVGYFGGLSEEKGVGKALDAAVRLSKSEVEFIFCGTGPLLERASQLASSGAIRAKIHSSVPYEEVRLLLRSCDFVINAISTDKIVLRAVDEIYSPERGI